MPVRPAEGPREGELYAALRRLIESGAAPAGAKLPTSRDLAARFAISRGAAVAAYERLTAEGFAVARVGAGTFVAESAPVLTRARTPRPPERAALPDTQACALGVASTDPGIVQQLRRSLSRRLAPFDARHYRYGDPRGDVELREALASYLRAARGLRCDAEQIIITAGARHGLDLVARALDFRGEPVWIESPCYLAARAVLTGAGARAVAVPVDAEGLDVARGEIACPQARAAYVTPSHQFPLGVTMSMRRRLALIDWARRRNAWILEDDYDSEFRYDGSPLTALQGIDDAERVVYFGTFAKALLPGLRIGYVVAPEALMDALIDIRQRSDRQPSTLLEGAVADFLDQGYFAAHLRRARRRARAQRDVLVEALAEFADVLETDTPSQGLHLVAFFRSASSDVQIVKQLHAKGVVATALSPQYIDVTPRQGLILGFSGFTTPELRHAAAVVGGTLRQAARSAA